MVELETLPQSTFMPDKVVRPPTPPKETPANETKSGTFDRVFGTAKRLFRRTSSITPQSSFEFPDVTTSTARKKVVWADLAGYDDVPSFSVEGSQIFTSPAPPLPPSAQRKAPKSILKSSSYNDLQLLSSMNGGTLSTPKLTTFAKMLESTTAQLGGEDRTAKVDAYMTLSRALKGTDNLPDMRALRGRMDKLVGFIKRDLSEKGEDVKPETSLALNALALLCSFFHAQIIAEMIPAEFAVWLVDFSIKTFEDPQASKDVARHLMFIVAKQNFASSVMSKDRVNKIFNSLHHIQAGSHTGKRIVDGRTNIYRTFLRQSKPYMLSNHLWLSDLFTDMTSKHKDTRANAIAFGLEAGFLLGAESKMTRAVTILFATEIEDKGKYGNLYVDQLKQMSQTDGEKDTSAPAAVPQIWSVVIMFFRGRIQLLDRWEFLTQWLKVISEAFNGSDIPARKEALLAWNRFIFVLHSAEITTSTTSASTLTKLLPQALEGQLRRGNMRAQAMNTLCCLLYYSLKSTNTPAQNDTYWNDYVVRLVGRSLTPADITVITKKTTLALVEATSILRWLFDNETKRNWTEQRILENQFPASELGPLDSKWLRKSADIVLPVLTPLLEMQYWSLADSTDVSNMWQAYIKSISAPATKEIKVSNDTMTSIATIFGFLHRIWRLGPKGVGALPLNGEKPSDSSSFLKSFDTLLLALIDGLGTLPFTDRQLCVGMQDIFTPIATPSQKPSKLRGEARTPLHHIIVLLSTISPNLEYDNSFARLVQRVLDPFFVARKNKTSRIEMSKSILEFLPAENTEPLRIIWQVIANATTIQVDTRDTGSKAIHEQPLGAVYKDLVKILEFGITLARNEPAPKWKSLFDTVSCSAVLDAGDSGKAIAVIEPLATSLLNKDPAITSLARLLHFSLLVGNAIYPKDRHALDAASKKIWGTVPLSQRSTTYDPFSRLYKYMQISLETSYTTFDVAKSLVYNDMLEATSALVVRCPGVLFFGLLSNIQDGIAHWLQNCELRFSNREQISTTVLSLWDVICASISRNYLDEDHSSLLAAHGDVLRCGLESKQRKVVNATIRFWNSTFGQSSQQLIYPAALQNTLLRLRTITEIQVPSLPASLLLEEDLDNRQQIDFEDTQFEWGSTFNISGLTPLEKGLYKSSPLPKIPNSSPIVTLGKSSFKRAREHTPERKAQKFRKHDTPKLRHDDSQVLFQAIDSSPVTDKVVDSQMLTDRQKEVRDRQSADAALFHNYKSSPRHRTRSGEDSDQELPIHRSSSQSSQLRARSNERQATPVLVAPSDDDDGFVASSPTPTRSIRGEVEDDALSSSPPQIARDIPVMDLEDVPTSPLEPVDEPELDSSAMGQAAQIDPNAIQQTPIAVSTYGSTVDFNDVLTGPENILHNRDTAAKLQDVEVEEGQERINNDTIDSSPRSDSSAEDSESFLSPGVQLRPQEVDPPSTPKTSRTAIVVGSGSPASSDIFEDAVSSPGAHIEKPITIISSSDLTDLDGSSMMRALEEAEDNNDRPESNSTRVLRSEGQQPPSSKATPQVVLSKSRLGELGQSVVHRASRRTRGHRPVTFSRPLPTPKNPIDASVAHALSISIMENDPSLNSENTIIVDTSALWEDALPSGSGEGKHQQRLLSTPAKKRKFSSDDVEEIDNSQQLILEQSLQSSAPTTKRARGRPRKVEVDPIDEQIEKQEDSQRWLREASSQSSIASTKKARGRPKKKSQPSLSCDETQISELDVGMTGADEVSETSSAGSKIWLQKSDVGIGSVFTDSNGIVPETNHKNGATTIAQPGSAEVEEEVFETSRADFESASRNSNGMSDEDSSMEIIEETRIMSQSAATPTKASTSQALATTPSRSMGPFSIMNTVREQLQALVNTLRSATLTRSETTEVEDGMMDVKEMLYGAARRGRNRAIEAEEE